MASLSFRSFLNKHLDKLSIAYKLGDTVSLIPSTGPACRQRRANFKKKSILDTDKIFWIIYIIDTATDIFRNFIIDTDTDTGI